VLTYAIYYFKVIFKEDGWNWSFFTGGFEMRMQARGKFHSLGFSLGIMTELHRIEGVNLLC